VSVLHVDIAIISCAVQQTIGCQHTAVAGLELEPSIYWDMAFITIVQPSIKHICTSHAIEHMRPSRDIFGLGLGLGGFPRFSNPMRLFALSVIFSIVVR
jgi:hypothetical protein